MLWGGNLLLQTARVKPRHHLNLQNCALIEPLCGRGPVSWRGIVFTRDCAGSEFLLCTAAERSASRSLSPNQGSARGSCHHPERGLHWVQAFFLGCPQCLGMGMELAPIPAPAPPLCCPWGEAAEPHQCPAGSSGCRAPAHWEG